MSILLGIDTGGTFTDAVLFDEDKGVLQAAKALTTKHDLSIGLHKAARNVLSAAPDLQASDIKLVSISTTLATNAIVESHGGAVGLVLIGQPAATLERAGLKQVMGSDPVLFLNGGHSASGAEKEPLDEDQVREAIRQAAKQVSAFAVAGYFAVRNPSHEKRVREIIFEECDLPVTCSYELSSSLDAPRRALTAVLNARLVPLIQHLVLAVEGFQKDLGLDCPLMVVKGDGSLISAETALRRPVETILSGPAASVVGAQYQASEKDMVVSDMGGTTTDIALLKDGQPVLNKDGAVVNGHRTMVEAVEVHTVGLGGDSEIRLNDHKELVAGPRRVVPLSLLSYEHPDLVVPVLQEQLKRGWSKTYDGRFALCLRGLDEAGVARLSSSERAIWDKLSGGPVALEVLLGRHMPEQPLRRLVDRGLVIISAFSPSDAAHVLGLHDAWDIEAARLGAEIWARSERRPNQPCAKDARDFAEQVREQVILQTGEALVDAILDDEFGQTAEQGQGLAKKMIRTALGDEKSNAGNLLRFSLRLGHPLIGIGAPAATYYADVATRLNTTYVQPEFAHVSNAVGAVAGGVSQRAHILITAPDDMRFRVHDADNIRDFTNLDEAFVHARSLAEAQANNLAVEAGAIDIHINTQEERRMTTGNGPRPIFIEGSVTATAHGRPRLATD
ncbi:hydantoinase/oxoprolinase family protein [Aestuariispira ectoiniformans]|uniref:hydantoinase/oxoprolinase family protein n=1 Tax=Aestuariispira ectoiniformans TaxID=2775080 RepID=UPI00223C429E|nr:hydantoinase/oxoprolinase family protein [Aestuariispira ectoiniformans]